MAESISASVADTALWHNAMYWHGFTQWSRERDVLHVWSVCHSTLLTMYNGEVGNFIMVKNWSLLFYISNDNVTLIECFYKLNSFCINICCFTATWKHNNHDKTCSETSFLVSVSNLLQIRSEMAELWPFNWFQNGGRRHLGFLHYVNFDSKSDCGTPFSACVSNSVQMHAIMGEFWPKMWFSIWRPPPSWILLDLSSGGKNCPGTLFSCLYQIWCKSVHKWRSYGRLTDFKMAAAAILNLLPASIWTTHEVYFMAWTLC